MDIREIREKFASDEYETSFHAEKERYAEYIKISDIENVISNCEIIEDYPDDPRGSKLSYSWLFRGATNTYSLRIYLNKMA